MTMHLIHPDGLVRHADSVPVAVATGPRRPWAERQVPAPLATALPPAMTPARTATTSVPVHPLLAQRWSPRGFDAAHQLSDRDLDALLEAARWAPSARNSQPWRFLVGRRGDDAFVLLTDMLATGNRIWAPRASALVLVVAQTTDETGRSRPWALYDTGQAVAGLSVQAEATGLSVHQMAGFDADAARQRFGLGSDLTPVVVLAVGRHDPAADLPEPLAAREHAPRTRQPLSALLLDRHVQRHPEPAQSSAPTGPA